LDIWHWERGFGEDEEFGAARQRISRQSSGAGDLENAFIRESKFYNANKTLLMQTVITLTY
jgi:hypothetical protein